MCHGRKLATFLLGISIVFGIACELSAQETPEVTSQEVLNSKDWKVLHVPGRKTARAAPLQEDSPLKSLESLEFSGPAPGHPFDLGEYSADADWQLVNGYLLPSDGKNAALQVAYADQFELEGIMDVSGVGGWFMLVGWDQGRGFSISNVTMRTAESGSPWFLTSYRGGQAIEGTHVEFPKYEWKGELPFKLVVRNEAFSLQIGRQLLFDSQPLTGYAPGAVVIGTYDTRYGPKKLRIKSLRIRSINADQKLPK